MDFQGDGGSPAGGGGGGGGYTNNYGGGGSQGSNEKRNVRSYDEQTLIPVSISMAYKAHPDSSGGGDGSALVLEDGRPLHTVKVVGAVRNVEDQSTNVLYTIEDGTGVMDVKQWLDDNDSSMVLDMRKETTKEGIYIKVIGQIKDYEGKKLLVANSVRPLSGGNELTHHLLEVIYSGEKFKRADSIVAPPMNGATTLGGNKAMGFNSSMPQGGGAGDDSIKDRVYAIMRDNDNGSEEGISIEQTIQFLPDIPQAEIRKVVSVLSEEGQIYSTVSESHFKVAM